jgi:hypothetical protein
MIDMMASTRNQQNQPLGLTDPGHGASGSNPFLMKGAALGVKSFTLQAPITKELGNSAELGENPGTTEYELNYRIKIEKVPGL